MITAVSSDRLQGSLDRAVDYLKGQQTDLGYWCGTVEMGVTTTLQDYLQRAFLDTMTPDVDKATANYIRRWQNDDGGFPKYRAGPSELSPSIEAYLALRIAGDEPQSPHMRRAADCIKSMGGLEEAPGFPTRFWLASFGCCRWTDVHPVPPELLYLPAWVPGNMLDFAAWVRQMLASFSIFTVKRPSKAMGFTLEELATGRRRRDLDVKHLAERAVLSWNGRRGSSLQTRALKRAEDWLVEHQDEAGYWCGGFSYAPMSLFVAGRPLDDPVVKTALDAIDDLAVWQGDERFMQPLNSHVGDTCLAVPALRGAGVPAKDPSIVRAARWLMANEVRGRGDWVGKRPNAEAGAWPFEIGNNWYPDNDDTSWAVRALRMAELPESDQVEAAIRRALAWMSEMQSKSGGWGAFDADNDSRLAAALYDNAGPVTDPPTADLTAHVVQAMAEEGMSGSGTVRRGVAWLWNAQEPEGPWKGRWYTNYIFGTASVALAMKALGAEHDPRLRRGIDWLRSKQNSDGGWGETFESFRDRSLMGIGPSTPSQTSWAIQALAATDPFCEEVSAGVTWLIEHQNRDGRWDEPEFTASSLSPFYDIRYSLMAEVIFPLTALGDYRRAIGAE